MVTTEERMQILKLIEAGQISAEEGARLLQALGDSPQAEDAPKRELKGRWLRVQVTDLNTGKTKVNITIPLSLVNVGMKMGARFVPDMEASSLDALRDAITQGVVGKVLDVEDGEDQERVQIFVE
jgi:hypothetical protein